MELTAQDKEFLKAYTELVVERGQSRVFGLRSVVSGMTIDGVVEFCFDPGTALVDQSVLEQSCLEKVWKSTLCTSWAASTKDGIVSYKGNTWCAPHIQFGHVHVTDSKIKTYQEATKLLYAGGVIQAQREIGAAYG